MHFPTRERMSESQREGIEGASGSFGVDVVEGLAEVSRRWEVLVSDRVAINGRVCKGRVIRRGRREGRWRDMIMEGRCEVTRFWLRLERKLSIPTKLSPRHMPVN